MEQAFVRTAANRSLTGLGWIALWKSSENRNANFCFSNDEECLLQAFRINWWYADIAETDESGKTFYKFGAINILNIPQKQFDTHMIHVYPSNDWEEEVTDYGAFEFSEVINDNLLIMTMPWGKEMLDCPLKDVINIMPTQE